MTQNSAVVEIETKDQFESLDIGQLVKTSDKIGVFAGLEWIQVCSCPCENIFQFPIIIYPTGGEGIEREVVHSLDKPRPKQINGYSIIDSVEKDDR